MQQEVEQKFDNVCYREKQLELEREIQQSKKFFWQNRNHPYVKKLQKISSFITQDNEKAILALKVCVKSYLLILIHYNNFNILC